MLIAKGFYGFGKTEKNAEMLIKSKVDERNVRRIV